jgi:hypothetical protein
MVVAPSGIGIYGIRKVGPKGVFGSVSKTDGTVLYNGNLKYDPVVGGKIKSVLVPYVIDNMVGVEIAFVFQFCVGDHSVYLLKPAKIRILTFNYERILSPIVNYNVIGFYLRFLLTDECQLLSKE